MRSYGLWIRGVLITPQNCQYILVFFAHLCYILVVADGDTFILSAPVEVQMYVLT